MECSYETMSKKRQAPLHNPYWHLINSSKRVRCANITNNKKNDEKKFELPPAQANVDETNKGGSVLSHEDEKDSITFFQDGLTAVITIPGNNMCNNENESSEENNNRSIPSIIYIPNRPQSTQSIISTMNQSGPLSTKDGYMMDKYRTRDLRGESFYNCSLTYDDDDNDDLISEDESLNTKSCFTSPFLTISIMGKEEEYINDDFYLRSSSLDIFDDWSINDNIFYDSTSFVGANLSCD